MSSSLGLSGLQAYDSDSESVKSSSDEDVAANGGTSSTSSKSRSKGHESKCKLLNAIDDDNVPAKRPRLLLLSGDDSHGEEKPESSLPFCVTNQGSKPKPKITGNGNGSEAPLALPLPRVPMNILQMFSETEGNNKLDDQTQHDGRIRSFPHIRGNWASYIYIDCAAEDKPVTTELNKIICDIGKSLAQEESLHLIQNKHLSLSRTLSFRHHWIDPFTANLKKMMSDFQSFDLCLDQFDVYTNEEKSRTFISMNALYTSDLMDIIGKCDKCLSEFQLEPYYKDPSLHVSCAWMLGDQSSWVKEKLIPILNKRWNEVVLKEPELQFFPVSTIEFKTGNKLYRFFMRKK